jgi:hypothetical protein
MKVYVDDIVKHTDFDEKYVRHVIYSNSGIYCNKNNKLVQIVYEDKCETTIYKDYKLYIDKGVESYGDTILHIPYDHLYCEEKYEKKNIGYDIYYVKCRYFDQCSYYFEFDQLNDFNLDIIISFLSNE